MELNARSFLVESSFCCSLKILNWSEREEGVDPEAAARIETLKSKVLELQATLRRRTAEAEGNEELLQRAKDGKLPSPSASEELSKELQEITLDVLSKRCKALEERVKGKRMLEAVKMMSSSNKASIHVL